MRRPVSPGELHLRNFRQARSHPALLAEALMINAMPSLKVYTTDDISLLPLILERFEPKIHGQQESH